ncbi:hypothetical protein XELAEV_18003205mg [Xenopus laevis]|nr:hypothetical protein XELAEV_18003205mg [Xenopus laevis]
MELDPAPRNHAAGVPVDGAAGDPAAQNGPFVLLHSDSNRLRPKPELKSIPRETKTDYFDNGRLEETLFSYWLKRESPSITDITSYLNQLSWQEALKVKSEENRFRELFKLTWSLYFEVCDSRNRDQIFQFLHM